jgi:hypothetical protein
VLEPPQIELEHDRYRRALLQVLQVSNPTFTMSVSTAQQAQIDQLSSTYGGSESNDGLRVAASPSFVQVAATTLSVTLLTMRRPLG